MGWTNEEVFQQIREANAELRRCVPNEAEYNKHLENECGCYINVYKCPRHLDEQLDVLRGQAARIKNPRIAEEGTEYAFTLTMPPDYQPAIPLQEAAKKIMEYGLTNKPYEKAIKYAYVLEHTEAGTPHVHGVYKTQSGRRISSKYFKRYHGLWLENEKAPGYKKLGNGFIGGYHQKARHSESYAAYLEKEGVVQKGEVLPPEEPEDANIISHV